MFSFVDGFCLVNGVYLIINASALIKSLIACHKGLYSALQMSYLGAEWATDNREA